MPSSRKLSSSADPFRLTFLIFAIIAFMYFTGEVLKPLALSVLLCFALTPAVRLLQRIGLPRALSVVLTVVLTLGLLGGIGYVVGNQLTSLANRLPNYQDNIEAKVRRLIKPGQQTAADKLANLADKVTAKIEKPPAEGSDEAVPIQKVQVVSQPSFQERLRAATGPYLEALGVGSFVLILVLFMLMGHKDISDRIVGLFGRRQVNLTTKTMEEIGQRISRYLATFALVNSGFGLVIGLGLAAIGVPYALLWGCLAAMLRFVPYVGPAIAFILPVVFSFAHFPGWTQVLEVLALFGVVEVALNSFLEPIIYGKTTGVSALGLLVAAMFWTWLWGTTGLLLSTPLTVFLAVLGKYVPSLRFFATLLGEEVELEPHLRLYQRLVASDQPGAVEVVDAALKEMSREELYDRILIPTLIRAELDAARDELDDEGQEFVWDVIGEILDGFDEAPEDATAAADGKARPAPKPKVPKSIAVVGLAAQDTSDSLALKMLGQVLEPLGCSMQIIEPADSPQQAVESVAGLAPGLIVVSHIPPEGLSTARVLVRQLRTRFPDTPLVVGRWGETGGAASAAERLVSLGATRVDFSMADAREGIARLTKPSRRKASRRGR
ncbi:AI-2E family transporter [Singulisphaera sp. PoT]|uniref:AI-2E family transporter n=1 Tax=Singulisphaera sp. PoT TaxID=3411797 RepID=UPI003BF490F6